MRCLRRCGQRTVHILQPLTVSFLLFICFRLFNNIVSNSGHVKHKRVSTKPADSVRHCSERMKPVFYGLGLLVHTDHPIHAVTAGVYLMSVSSSAVSSMLASSCSSLSVVVLSVLPSVSSFPLGGSSSALLLPTSAEP